MRKISPADTERFTPNPQTLKLRFRHLSNELSYARRQAEKAYQQGNNKKLAAARAEIERLRGVIAALNAKGA